MGLELTARISVKLPADAKQQAHQASAVMTAWRTFVDAVGTSENAVAELRIGPEPEVKRRRGRPRRPFVVAPEAAE
jgi:hypothetical protein